VGHNGHTMNDGGDGGQEEMTISQRIAFLESTVLLARREIALTSLVFIAANDAGDEGDVGARLVALGAMIADAEDKLEVLYAAVAQRDA
jgi:hypothetical protein